MSRKRKWTNEGVHEQLFGILSLIEDGFFDDPHYYSEPDSVAFHSRGEAIRRIKLLYDKVGLTIAKERMK